MTLDAKYREMTETPVPRLVMRLALPSMVSMVVTALYNVVDAAFVGHLSTEATAGIGISFAYMTFIQAVGFSLATARAIIFRGRLVHGR